MKVILPVVILLVVLFINRGGALSATSCPLSYPNSKKKLTTTRHKESNLDADEGATLSIHLATSSMMAEAEGKKKEKEEPKLVERKKASAFSDSSEFDDFPSAEEDFSTKKRKKKKEEEEEELAKKKNREDEDAAKNEPIEQGLTLSSLSRKLIFSSPSVRKNSSIVTMIGVAQKEEEKDEISFSNPASFFIQKDVLNLHLPSHLLRNLFTRKYQQRIQKRRLSFPNAARESEFRSAKLVIQLLMTLPTSCPVVPVVQLLSRVQKPLSGESGGKLSYAYRNISLPTQQQRDTEKEKNIQLSSVYLPEIQKEISLMETDEHNPISIKLRHLVNRNDIDNEQKKSKERKRGKKEAPGKKKKTAGSDIPLLRVLFPWRQFPFFDTTQGDASVTSNTSTTVPTGYSDYGVEDFSDDGEPLTPSQLQESEEGKKKKAVLMQQQHLFDVCFPAKLDVSVTLTNWNAQNHPTRYQLSSCSSEIYLFTPQEYNGFLHRHKMMHQKELDHDAESNGVWYSCFVFSLLVAAVIAKKGWTVQSAVKVYHQQAHSIPVDKMAMTVASSSSNVPLSLYSSMQKVEIAPPAVMTTTTTDMIGSTSIVANHPAAFPQPQSFKPPELSQTLPPSTNVVGQSPTQPKSPLEMNKKASPMVTASTPAPPLAEEDTVSPPSSKKKQRMIMPQQELIPDVRNEFGTSNDENFLTGGSGAKLLANDEGNSFLRSASPAIRLSSVGSTQPLREISNSQQRPRMSGNKIQKNSPNAMDLTPQEHIFRKSSGYVAGYLLTNIGIPSPHWREQESLAPAMLATSDDSVHEVSPLGTPVFFRGFGSQRTVERPPLLASGGGDVIYDEGITGI